MFSLLQIISGQTQLQCSCYWSISGGTHLLPGAVRLKL